MNVALRPVEAVVGDLQRGYHRRQCMVRLLGRLPGAAEEVPKAGVLKANTQLGTQINILAALSVMLQLPMVALR